MLNCVFVCWQHNDVHSLLVDCSASLRLTNTHEWIVRTDRFIQEKRADTSLAAWRRFCFRNCQLFWPPNTRCQGFYDVMVLLCRRPWWSQWFVSLMLKHFKPQTILRVHFESDVLTSGSSCCLILTISSWFCCGDSSRCSTFIHLPVRPALVSLHN